MSENEQNTNENNPTNLTRQEIQDRIANSVYGTIAGLGIEIRGVSNRPTRRVIRACLRATANLAVAAGYQADLFIGLATTAIGRELTREALSAVKAEPAAGSEPEPTDGESDGDETSEDEDADAA